MFSMLIVPPSRRWSRMERGMMQMLNPSLDWLKVVNISSRTTSSVPLVSRNPGVSTTSTLMLAIDI
jgi:hypothetical protein